MHGHRPLSQLLDDVLGAVLSTPIHAVRARSIELSLPIETFLSVENGEPTLMGDVPLWRWRTDFDLLPGRLKVTLETSGP